MKIRTHKDLKVYQLAFNGAMKIFEISKRFHKDETYSITDQIRRSSSPVFSNQAEAFRKRKYPKSFITKLSDPESEAAETQTRLDLGLTCKYIAEKEHTELCETYDNITGKLVNMSMKPENWS